MEENMGDHIISGISFNILKSDITIGDIIEKFGMPGEVFPYECRIGYCGTVLIFRNYGMLIEIPLKERQNKSGDYVELSPFQIIARIEFFPMDAIEKTWWFNSPLYEEKSYLWKGYTTYP